MDEQQNCLNGSCYCQVRLLFQKLTHCISFDDLLIQTGESPIKLNNCVTILEMYDIACRDGKMICPDNP